MAFCHLQENGDKNGKKIIDTTTKTGIASKRVVLKISEATGDLIRSKIANKISSLGKTKSKKKEKKNRINLHTTRKKTADY